MDRSLVSRATEGTNAPTPGYLYVDIAKNAASSPSACMEVAQYLTRRLASKNNHNIKYKCLKVIAKTAESSVTRGQFKRVICQDPSMVSSIKDALQFRGPPDPARGDEIYERVRTAAKEALDAIYSDTPTSTDMGGIGSGGYGGMGSGSAQSFGGGGGSGGGGGGRKMEGIGNPMFPDPRLSQPTSNNMTMGDFVKEAGETIVGMIKDPLARNAPNPTLGGGGGTGLPGYANSGSYAGPPGRNQLAQATGGQWTMASNRGPNAVIPPQNFNSEKDSSYFKARDAGSTAFSWAQQGSSGASISGGGVGGSWASMSTGGGGSSIASQAREPPYQQTRSPPYASPSATATTTTTRGSGGTASADGAYEKNLIMELCPPGGMKPEPPPDKLARFAQAIPSLNPDLVCPALLDCLEEGQPWIIRAKALCVMETCISVAERYKIDGSNKYADFFFTCRGEIEPLAGHPRSAIKEPAKRVLALLGITPEVLPPASAPPPPPVAAPPAAPPADLLDFGDDTPAVPAVPPPAAAPPPEPPVVSTPAPAMSLFGGLKTKETPAPVPSQPTSNLLGDGPAPAPTPGSVGGLFDAMTIKSPAPAPEPPAAEAPSAFGFVNEQAPPAPAPAPAASGFSFMGGEPPKAEQPPQQVSLEDVAKASAVSSGFSFMAGESAPAAAAVAAPTIAANPTPAPSRASFDPLNNGYVPSPNTQKNVMDLRQLQAMYAQQLNMSMLQQMQQVQQIQLAMAMQQQQQQPPIPQPMQAQLQTSNPRVMAGSSSAGMATTSSFSFLDVGAQPPSRKKEDKSFDFINATIQSEKKK